MVTVFLVDDHEVVRRGLIDLLSADQHLAARVKSFDLHAPAATRVD